MLILSEFNIEFTLPAPTAMVSLLQLHPSLEPRLRSGNELLVESLGTRFRPKTGRRSTGVGKAPPQRKRPPYSWGWEAAFTVVSALINDTAGCVYAQKRTHQVQETGAKRVDGPCTPSAYRRRHWRGAHGRKTTRISGLARSAPSAS